MEKQQNYDRAPKPISMASGEVRWAQRIVTPSPCAIQSIISTGDPPVALLLWHGAADRLIATRETERLHQTLAPLYSAAGHPERLQLTLAAEAAHNFTDPQVLGDVRRSVASWFDAHL